MSQDARLDEEQNTQRRARVLGLAYTDTSIIDPKTLYKDILSKEELYSLKIIPLQVDKSNIYFGITTNTSQQSMSGLTQRFADFRVYFSIISDIGYREYMHLYDPPKKIVYEDISIKEGNQAQVDKVSDVLEQVRADDLLAFLVAQAHTLNASDIHIETQVENVRVRIRIDGVLHPVAYLKQDKYRTLIRQ